MKKIDKKSQLGSIMIEALSMLGLIAIVTPVLYKKSAERTSELQDINAASEMRAIVKAVDDYISSNYDKIVAGDKVSNTCPGSNAEVNYSDFKDKTDASKTVPIGHFCEFLPYGILNADGSAQDSRFFSSDYKIALKLKGSSDAKGDKVITAFVVTDPRQNLPMVRSSSIASMIGGNGGYVSEVKSDKGGTVLGNLGLWGIGNTKTELGVEAKKGAIVAASIQGISSQNANIDLEGVMYRTPAPISTP